MWKKISKIFIFLIYLELKLCFFFSFDVLIYGFLCVKFDECIFVDEGREKLFMKKRKRILSFLVSKKIKGFVFLKIYLEVYYYDNIIIIKIYVNNLCYFKE